MTAHIFAPIIKEAGFKTFICRKKTGGCYNCGRKCLVHRDDERKNWIGVMLGTDLIGVITLFDGMVRFRSAGISNGNFKVGAKIGLLHDPLTVDKIARQLKRTARKRVPIELHKSTEYMLRNTRDAEWRLENAADELKSFLEAYDDTLKGWLAILDQCEKIGLPTEPAPDKYQDELNKIKSPEDLQFFIKKLKKLKPTLNLINKRFAQVLKREVK
jgi:hypothetical protein